MALAEMAAQSSELIFVYSLELCFHNLTETFDFFGRTARSLSFVISL